MIAHRGASERFPENTPAAFDAALAAGCDGIELDVQLSADGVPFLYHDRTLARIGAGRRRASSVLIDGLKSLDAGSWLHPRFRAERIPTLEEVLDRYAGRTLLLIEIKVRTPADSPERRRILAREVAGMVRARAIEKSTALLCFDLDTLAAARAAAPRSRIVLNANPRTGRLPRAARAAL
ncbi:MAG TPA: glycerophosphodiester phosphodiesterase family protein, partial [Candidatus Saccharimonadales bacterium]|nr:glycerophosphodiester phosphodiesterase family protein [Candidatus Saccharimonadales bacterium]